MSMIQFVSNYEDLSTDKGYQFKFYCDKCGNGYMSSYQTSTLGIASSLLNSASNLLGWGHSAGNSAYELQRAVGGKAHDAALKTAVEEGKRHFHQCSRCGKWVCPDVCWNARAGQCEECAPDFGEEIAAAEAQAKAEALRRQLYEKAQNTDYVSNVDMSAGAQTRSPHSVINGSPQNNARCAACGHDLGEAKFCPECGTPAARQAKPLCPDCGFKPRNAVKFCPECGTKMSF
jgi:membrane protease subunit (stomatin/prohibitin family)